MRLMNIRSRIHANSAIATFAPNQSGKMGWRWENGDVTVFAIEKCDHCGKEVEGANSITFVKPRNFVLESLAVRKIVERNDIMDEGGCNDDGDFVCPKCYAEAVDGDEADKILLELGEGGAG